VSLVRFGISLDNILLERFDSLIGKKGYANRSEAIRDLIRDSLVMDEWESRIAETVGTITIVYSHDKRELTDTLTELQHHYFSSIISSMHIHLDEHNCLEVIVVKGSETRKALCSNDWQTFKVVFFAVVVARKAVR